MYDSGALKRIVAVVVAHGIEERTVVPIESNTTKAEQEDGRGKKNLCIMD